MIPVASTSSLAEAARGPPTIERMGRDRYGRTLALVAGALGELLCWQVRRRQTRYVAAGESARAGMCNLYTKIVTTLF